MDTNDEESEGQSGHEAIINDSWLRAREHIRRAEAADLDPTRALWPLEQRTPAYRRALSAHAATIQMRDDIFAFRDESARESISDMWDETVCEVVVDGGEQDVSLANLDEWAHAHTTKVSEFTNPVRGRVREETRYRLLIPVSVCRALYRHMQDILKALGLAAETKNYTDEGEAKPQHLVGLLDERGQQEAKGKLPERFSAGSES